MKHAIKSEMGESPLVLTDHHSATKLPEGFELAFNLAIENPRVWSTVFYEAPDSVVPLATGYRDTKHTKIWTDLPRAIVDAIRAPNQIDFRTVQGNIAYGEHKVKEEPNGLYWAGSIERPVTPPFPELLLKRPWSIEEQKYLQEFAYAPFVSAIRDAMQSAKERYGFAVLLDLHHAPNDMALVMDNSSWKGAYAHGHKISKPGTFAPHKPEWHANPTLPDAILICAADGQGNPTSCHPRITDIVRRRFEADGLYVEPGFGKLSGADYGPPAMYGKPKEGMHVLSLELLAVQDNVHPGRGEGKLDYNLEACTRMRKRYADIFEEFASLKLSGLK